MARSQPGSARSGYASDGVCARLLVIFWARRVIRAASCPSVAEVVAGDEPVGAVAGAGRLDVGGLLAGLPAAGEHDGALDGRALLPVDVLRVCQPQRVRSSPASWTLRCDPSSVTVTPRSWMALTCPRVPFSTRGCPAGGVAR